jgi:hypothetical protein
MHNVPPEQQPLVQVLPAQHGWPVLPQSWQTPAEEVEVVVQTEPAVHRSVPLAPEQHCSPGCPHGEHMLLRQARPAPQLVPQQGCPEVPQPEHLPALHTPGLVPLLPPVPPVELPQVAPSPTHISA